MDYTRVFVEYGGEDDASDDDFDGFINNDTIGMATRLQLITAMARRTGISELSKDDFDFSDYGIDIVREFLEIAKAGILAISRLPSELLTRDTINKREFVNHLSVTVLEIFGDKIEIPSIEFMVSISQDYFQNLCAFDGDIDMTDAQMRITISDLLKDACRAIAAIIVSKSTYSENYLTIFQIMDIFRECKYGAPILEHTEPVMQYSEKVAASFAISNLIYAVNSGIIPATKVEQAIASKKAYKSLLEGLSEARERFRDVTNLPL